MNVIQYICTFIVIFMPGCTCLYPFQNFSLPWDDRVNDLVGRLTLDEIKEQMAKGGAGTKAGPAPPIPRLNIGPYQWNEECLRGVAIAGEATAFPQAIGLAAAFSQQLIFDVAEATGVEVRAKHNDYVKKKQYGDHKGLSCFSPVINIMRHPLWGRNQETYGEDPYLSGIYAENFVKGLQGNHVRYVRANAGCKHFDVHGGPENIPLPRFSFNAKVSDRDWRLTFLPAFRACVLAGSYSLMCSYNSVNGVPACANRKLLTSILREKWGFKGYVISDDGALENIIYWHQYLTTPVDTAAECIKAGCNIELSGNNPYIYDAIVDAVKQNKVSETLVRERVKPLFYTRMRLGEFDPPNMNPYLQYNLSLVQSPAHRQLAVKAAMQTFVLLKNKERLLPIKKHFNRIAILGPMANNLNQLYGDYAADIDPRFVKTPLQGLSAMTDRVNYAAGCSDNKCDNYTADAIKAAVKDVQLVIICVGTGQELESEGNDRRNMNLAGNQSQLIQDAIDSVIGSPVLLLVFSAGPVNISFADKDPRVEAIMQCFFPAQATGEALYNTITMATEDASPAGRLPYTWYDTADQIPSMTEYTMTGRTYRYFRGTPLYPFGYGLSYSSFKYVKISVMPTITVGEDQHLFGQVTNTGLISAYEVVQVYMSWLSTNETMPNIQLVGFQKLYIKSGTTQEFQLVISLRQMAVWTDNGFVVQPGKMALYVSGQQPFQKKTTGSNTLTAKFEIVGQEKRLAGKF
ncbi:uncharacterized protein LOC123552447 [Mercenaria mercenaria]|uniref:uncharacterized protein LOC123552447 n=1 Tax=Mercenaria mercenaria TaxID=6596 RepID=UPI00234EB6FD|nr:uncharacterized protein LOC123552447 [Mercenaria mercenaria]